LLSLSLSNDVLLGARATRSVLLSSRFFGHTCPYTGQAQTERHHLSRVSHLNKEICISASEAVTLYPLL